jgi:hypothetical protein
LRQCARHHSAELPRCSGNDGDFSSKIDLHEYVPSSNM